MLTVLEHHAEPLAASNTTFKIDTRDEQLEKAALRDPLQIPPNALARGSICPGSERPVALLSPPSLSSKEPKVVFFVPKVVFLYSWGHESLLYGFRHGSPHTESAGSWGHQDK